MKKEKSPALQQVESSVGNIQRTVLGAKKRWISELLLGLVLFSFHRSMHSKSKTVSKPSSSDFYFELQVSVFTVSLCKKPSNLFVFLMRPHEIPQPRLFVLTLTISKNLFVGHCTVPRWYFLHFVTDQLNIAIFLRRVRTKNPPWNMCPYSVGFFQNINETCGSLSAGF